MNNTELFVITNPLDQLVHFSHQQSLTNLILTFYKVAALYQGRLDRAVAILTKLSESTRFIILFIFFQYYLFNSFCQQMHYIT